MKLLAMSGFIPEQICDVRRFTGYTGERNITHYCGYANDFISQVLNDQSVEGAVFPQSCDSSRIIMSYLKDAGKYVFQINVPARNDSMATEFMAKELELYKRTVEEAFCISIGDIPERIERINHRNARIGMCYEQLEEISYGDYLRQIHSSMSLPLYDSEDMDISKIIRKSTYSHRVYLVGSFLANSHIADIIENNGLGIVGDNLPESGRIKGSHINPDTKDVFYGIAEDILRRRPSPTQNEFSKLMNIDIEEIKKLKAEAVIFVTQKYCEPYDYLYSVYKKRLDKENIPSLKISLTDSEDERKVGISVEAFADML